MFCPNCAAQNVADASFCRVCGANISLVPQALSGHLTQVSEEEAVASSSRSRRRHGKGEPSIDHVVKNVFMGIAFLLVSVALAFSRLGASWWFWMLIPAFSMMGTGVAQYLRLKEQERRPFLPRNLGQPTMEPPRVAEMFPTRGTGELKAPPPSVTEGTTRHLGAEAATRHFDDKS
jgi:hypothetical protein